MCLIFTLQSFSVAAEKIKLVVTSDLHGWLSTSYLYPRKRPSGLCHLKDQIEDLREKHPETIVIDGGDLLQGSPLAHFYNHIGRSVEDNPVYQQILAMKYDAIVLGNHDIGIIHWRKNELLNNGRIPWIAANILDCENGTPVFEPYRILKKDDFIIVVIGFITAGIRNWTLGNILAGIKVEPVKKSVNRWLKTIKEEVDPDVIIGVFHMSVDPLRDDAVRKRKRIKSAENIDLILLENQEIDLAILGHDHYLSPSGTNQQLKYISNIPVIHPGSWGNAAIVLSLNIPRKRNEGMTFIELDRVLKPDISKKLTEEYRQGLKPAYLEYINSPTPFKVDATTVEIANKCLNLLAAMSINDSGSDGSLLPTAKWRNFQGYVGHQLYRKDLFKLFPYDNHYVKVGLCEKEISLLSPTDEGAEWRSRKYSPLFLYDKLNRFPKAESRLAKQNGMFDRAYNYYVSDYHLAGGAGVLSSGFIRNTRNIDVSEDFIRDRVMNYLLRPDIKLPAACRFLKQVN